MMMTICSFWVRVLGAAAFHELPSSWVSKIRGYSKIAGVGGTCVTEMSLSVSMVLTIIFPSYDVAAATCRVTSTCQTSTVGMALALVFRRGSCSWAEAGMSGSSSSFFRCIAPMTLASRQGLQQKSPGATGHPQSSHTGTLTRHLLQNLSPGFMGFPQALQTTPGEGAGPAEG